MDFQHPASFQLGQIGKNDEKIFFFDLIILQLKYIFKSKTYSVYTIGVKSVIIIDSGLEVIFYLSYIMPIFLINILRLNQKILDMIFFSTISMLQILMYKKNIETRLQYGDINS